MVFGMVAILIMSHTAILVHVVVVSYGAREALTGVLNVKPLACPVTEQRDYTR